MVILLAENIIHNHTNNGFLIKLWNVFFRKFFKRKEMAENLNEDCFLINVPQ